jgi:hypothetical protein
LIVLVTGSRPLVAGSGPLEDPEAAAGWMGTDVMRIAPPGDVNGEALEEVLLDQVRRCSW